MITFSAIRSLLMLHPARLAVAPALRVTARTPEATRVAIDGLVCAVCAARTHTALARLPGVEAVRVDFASGTAEVRHAPGAAPTAAALERALASVVVLPWARRWLARAIHTVCALNMLRGAA